MWEMAIFWYELSLWSCIFIISFHFAGNTGWILLVPGWTTHTELVFAWALTGIPASVQVALWNRTLGNGEIWCSLVSGLARSQAPKVDEASSGGDRGAVTPVSFPTQWRKVNSGSYGWQLSFRCRGMWEPTLSQMICEQGHHHGGPGPMISQAGLRTAQCSERAACIVRRMFLLGVSIFFQVLFEETLSLARASVCGKY